MGAAAFVRDKESVRKFFTVAATIVVPYALWPLVMVGVVLYFSVWQTYPPGAGAEERG